MSISLISGHQDRSFPYRPDLSQSTAEKTPAAAANTAIASVAATTSAGIDALARLLGQLATTPSAGRAESTPAANTTTGKQDDTVRSILNSWSEAGEGQQGSGAGAQPTSVAATSTSIKPNLDALNRVLAHYAAQSAVLDIGGSNPPT